ncbi:MAG: hypothetical protein ACE5E4_12375, partial [Candidatus Binatia bacterium]
PGAQASKRSEPTWREGEKGGGATTTVKIWRSHGLLHAHAYNDKNQCLYEHPGDEPPVKAQGQKLSERRRFPNVEPNRTEEVQCEA